MGTASSRTVVSGTYEAFGGGDLDALFAAFSQDVVWVEPATPRLRSSTVSSRASMRSGRWSHGSVRCWTSPTSS